MTDAQLRRLEAIHRRATRYEVVAVSPDGEQLRIGYTIHRSRHGLLRCCQLHGEDIITALRIDESALMYPGKRASDGFTIGPWALRFSGRTERDAILAGELSHIAGVTK